MRIIRFKSDKIINNLAKEKPIAGISGLEKR